jgi:hypothetical protein
LATFPAVFLTFAEVFQNSIFPLERSDGLETAANSHGFSGGFQSAANTPDHMFFPASCFRRL